MTKLKLFISMEWYQRHHVDIHVDVISWFSFPYKIYVSEIDEEDTNS